MIYFNFNETQHRESIPFTVLKVFRFDEMGYIFSFLNFYFLQFLLKYFQKKKEMKSLSFLHKIVGH